MNHASEDYRAAKLNFDGECYYAAINRAYYCIFHMMNALLMFKGMSFKSHAAVISAFQREYIKTGIFDESFTKIISKASDMRNDSDYEKGFAADEDMVKKSLADVKFFNDTILEYINGLIAQNQ